MAVKHPRCRFWSATRHYKYDLAADMMNGGNGFTEDEWKERIRKEFAPDVQTALSVVLMFHDMDVEDDGQGGIVPKPLHVHVVIHYTESIPESVALARTGVTRPENCKQIPNKKRLVHAYLYLTHSTERARKQRKYEYDVSAVEVYLTNGYHFDYRTARFGKIENIDKLEAETQRVARLCVTHMVKDGELTIREAQSIYENDVLGCDFDALVWNQHRTAYEQDREEYKSHMVEWLTLHHRCLTNIYVEGATSRAKTDSSVALARYFGDSQPYHLVGTRGKGKTFDFADGYDGQKVTMVNELQGDFYEPAEFCNLFDPIHAPIANSRNKDKAWFADYCINTTSCDFETFLWSCYLPYAKDRIPVGAKDLKTARDWQNHYESDSNVASKIAEMRRRWQLRILLVDVEDDVGNVTPSAEIYVQTNVGKDTLHCFYRDDDKSNYEKSGIWYLYATVPLRNPSDYDNYCRKVDEALHYYYETLHPDYFVTPWNVERPEFREQRELKNKDLQAALDDMDKLVRMSIAGSKAKSNVMQVPIATVAQVNGCDGTIDQNDSE